MASGSQQKMTYQGLIPKPETTLGAGYTDPQVVHGPVEIVNLHGVVFQSEHGETLWHMHGTPSDQYGKAYTGHVATVACPLSLTLDGMTWVPEPLRPARPGNGLSVDRALQRRST